ncbi:MAG: DNA-processing protein DprA [Lachnospiraceae bacterium]|nr:DNA-processing protein DprA [Lachnospiraceae bacterium]
MSQQKVLENWLAGINEIGPVKAKVLLDAFGCEEGIWNATKGELEKLEKINEKDIAALLDEKRKVLVTEEYEKLSQKGIRIVSIHDEDYPESLRVIDKMPYALYVRGALPDVHKASIAIVGARTCTPYGREIASWFGRELSKAGVQVISGMAYGIDSVAHNAALEGKTPTFAVLGSGIDVCYPKENFNLYMEICKQGGIISEYGLGVPGKAFQFPMRNRIISGLCDGVLVVEARKRSGSLITADFALEHGKSVFALPGRIGDVFSEGCLNLIKQGAEPVTEPGDILKSFQMEQIVRGKMINAEPCELDTPEKILYASLSLEPKHIETIVEETGFLVTECLALLLKMELDGFVNQTSQNWYTRKIIEG